MPITRRLMATLSLLLGTTLLVPGCQQQEAADAPAPRATPADLTAQGLDALRHRDWHTALADLQPAAEAGDMQARMALGSMYFTGLGTEVDYADATNWLTPPARQGAADAQFELGMISERGGSGVLQDRAAAAQWYNAPPPRAIPAPNIASARSIRTAPACRRISPGRWRSTDRRPPAATPRR